MPVPIPPLREENLPERKLSFWQLAGPGAIMIGLAIGAGELAVWPWVTAKFGAVMIWAAALGVFLQLWINIEIGRWAVVTGEHPYTSYARMSMGVIYAFLSLGFVGLFLPGWARMSGAALKALFFGPDGPGPEWFWTAVTFGLIALILFGPKQMYKAVERAIGIMVLVITIGLIYVAFSVGTWDAIKEMGRGLVNFGHIELDDQFTFARFFGAVVFAGIGGAGNLWYAFYLRDKNIGMGGRIPVLANPLRVHETAEVQTGFRYHETPENASRFRRWMRYVIQDQVIFFWLGNTFTMFLFMFGALTVLRPAGHRPRGGPDRLGHVGDSGDEPRHAGPLRVPADRHGRAVQLPARRGRRRRPHLVLSARLHVQVRPEADPEPVVPDLRHHVHGRRHGFDRLLRTLGRLGTRLHLQLRPAGRLRDGDLRPADPLREPDEAAEVRPAEGAQHRDDADRLGGLRVLHPVHDLGPHLRLIGD